MSEPRRVPSGLKRRAGTVADLLDDVLIEFGSRRARALLMVLAVGLSTGALQASAGISAQASQQISADIAASTLDLLTVSVVPQVTVQGPDEAVQSAATVLPDDTESRLERIDLVMAGGRQLDVSAAVSPVVTRLPNSTVAASDSDQAPDVIALTSGYLRAARADVPADLSFFLDGDEPVAFLGKSAANTLGVPVTSDPTGLQVSIDGEPFDVVGFLGSAEATPLDNVIAVPYARGLAMAGSDADTSVLVRTEPGAGARVSAVMSLALRPDAPELLEASSVVSVSELRRGVSTQMSKLAAWTGLTLLVLTVLLIANAMVVAVMARTAEIGLRRALGFSRKKVAAVFLTEGVVIGFLGGLVGSALSAGTVVAAAALNGWTAVVEPHWVAIGPAMGIAVGLVASVYPARRASLISPAMAVRSE